MNDVKQGGNTPVRDTRFAGSGYRFRHELVRQALADQVPPHQRLTVHREAAERLESVGAEPAVIARHWIAGARPEQATRWLLAAAREARRLGAYRDCLATVDRLLAHEAGHPEALCLRADALDALGDIRALAAYDAAAAAVLPSESSDLRAKRALAQVKLGDPRGALESLHGVVPTSVEGRLAEALTFCGSAALGHGDPAQERRRRPNAGGSR